MQAHGLQHCEEVQAMIDSTRDEQLVRNLIVHAGLLMSEIMLVRNRALQLASEAEQCGIAVVHDTYRDIDRQLLHLRSLSEKVTRRLLDTLDEVQVAVHEEQGYRAEGRTTDTHMRAQWESEEVIIDTGAPAQWRHSGPDDDVYLAQCSYASATYDLYWRRERHDNGDGWLIVRFGDEVDDDPGAYVYGPRREWVNSAPALAAYDLAAARGYITEREAAGD